MLAEKLIALRRAKMRRPFELDEFPANVEEAYRVAARTLALDGRRIAAWKLGATTAGTRNAFATDTVYFGAITEAEIWVSGECSSHLPPPVFRAEAEIAFRLAIDIEAADATAVMLELAPAAIFDAWAPALEAPYSCIENIPEVGLTALLADRCAAGALFLATPRADIADPAIDQQIAIAIDGEIAAAGSASTSLLMSPMAAALEFLSIAPTQGAVLSKGQWVSTGGITPCIELPVDGRVIELQLGGRSVFDLDLATR